MEYQIDVANDPIITARLGQFAMINKTIEGLIITAENEGQASDNLHAIKQQIKDINTQRLAITKPIDEAKKEVMLQARIVLEPLEKAKGVLGSKLLAYQVEKRRIEEEHQRLLIEETARRLREEQAELEEQAEINESELALEEAIEIEDRIEAVQNLAVKGTGRVQSNLSTTSLSYKWGFLLKDFSKVPDEFKKLDEVKIRRIISGENGTHEIPGLKITKEPTLSTRGR